MKKITLLFSLLFVQFIFAQFTQNDVKYWVGEGSKSVVFIADFKTDYTPSSYAWGYRFEEEGLNMKDLIDDVANSVGGISHNTEDGLLRLFDYYHQVPTGDYWSTWSGDSFETLTANMGIEADILENGKFYAISYGFGPAPDYEAYAPDEPVAAYDATTFTKNNISEWNGNGDNETVVVIDFGTDSNNIANSYAFGVRFEEETINANEMLEIIQSNFEDFDYEILENQLSNLSFIDHSGTTGDNSNWKLYKGQNLASWYEVASTDIPTANNEWVGFAFGNRLPFTPTDAVLDTNIFDRNAIIVYPNPVAERLFITLSKEAQIIIFDVNGKKITTEIYTSNGIDVSSLSNGVYLIQIQQGNTSSMHRFIKR